MNEKYKLLKKRLQACIDSPHKRQSLCDANNILCEIAQTEDLEESDIRKLMELYFIIKKNAK